MAAPGAREVDHLLRLALSRPRETLARARAVLAGHPDPYDASVAHQAAAIVLRDRGDTAAALRETRAALHQARKTGSADREADVLASLGIALVYAGRTAAGLTAFDQAVQRSSGVLKARVLARRGLVLYTLGRYPEALEDLRYAVAVLRRAEDALWAARALNNRGLVNLALGSTSRADADLVAAESLYVRAGHEEEAMYIAGNRALVAFAAGDLPAALALFDEAIPAYLGLKVPTTQLRIDRCAVLLAAGLATEALAEAESSVEEIEQVRDWSTQRAYLLLMAANCALAAGQPSIAGQWARSAHRLFRSQHSAWWQAHAAHMLVQARYQAVPVSPALFSEAARAAAQLDLLRSADAPLAHQLAGRIALDLGRREDSEAHLAAAARTRRRGPPLSRVSGWLAEALRAEVAGQSNRMLAACRQGLNVLDEHLLTLGASELRAQASVHGAELAALAQRHAARSGPRLLLAWSERWRVTALTVPPVRRTVEADLSAALTALRGVTRQLEAARSTGQPVISLEREQRRLEGAVRAAALRVRGLAGAARTAFRTADLLDELGPAQLAEIIEIDGTLHVLLCGAGRVRQFTAGQMAEAAKAADFARFALRRLGRGRPGDDPASAQAILTAAGPRLEQALIGPAIRHLGDGPVIIVPPARLHTIPWALLPALRDRVFSVAPSAGAWMRARSAPVPGRRNITLARGPGLASNGAEIPLVAQMYDDVTVLGGDEATTEKVLYALDGAGLAHIAAHGIFRADSPLFSSLHMHDGPLTVYDFEQLRRAPYRLVLSSCDSGVLAPAGANELLGLVSSLLPLGTAGIAAAVVSMNDQAAVRLMVELHRHLRAGQSLAEAVCGVRRGLAGDPIQHATAMSLVALGAA